MNNHETDALMWLRTGERLAEFSIKYRKIANLNGQAIKDLYRRGAVDTPYSLNTVLTRKGRRCADMWLSDCISSNVATEMLRDQKFTLYQIWIEKQNDSQLEPDYQNFGVYIYNKDVIGYITEDKIEITCTGVKCSPTDIITHQQRELDVWDKAQIVQKELQCLQLSSLD